MMTMTTRCEAERHYRLYRPIYFYEPSLPWYCFIVITNIMLMIIVNIMLMNALMMSTININAYRYHQENLMILLRRDYQHNVGDHQNYLWSRSTSWWLSKLIAITARTWALSSMIMKLECCKVLNFLHSGPHQWFSVSLYSNDALARETSKFQQHILSTLIMITITWINHFTHFQWEKKHKIN